MIFRTHIVFSVAVYLVLNYFLEMPIWVLGFVLLASVFVDIDGKKSRVGDRWYFRPLQVLFGHRGVVHSLTFGLVLSSVVGLISLWGGFGFFVGYVSHLFLDCLTPSGVRLFWPLKFKVKGFVKSGGIFEDVFFVLVLLFDVVGIWNLIF